MSLTGSQTSPTCAPRSIQLFSFCGGFYRVVDQTLSLVRSQGPIACTRISPNQGVCGAAWSANKPIRVDDVDAFPGHIACSSESRSEIVVPISVDGQVVAVLDIDSHRLVISVKSTSKPSFVFRRCLAIDIRLTHQTSLNPPTHWASYIQPLSLNLRRARTSLLRPTVREETLELVAAFFLITPSTMSMR